MRDVSRSFYLTLRVLPRAYREPISLAYLLARISDTLADTAEVSIADRLAALQVFVRAVEGGSEGRLAETFSVFINNTTHEGERVLLQSADACLDWLQRVPADQAALIREVVAIITDGQSWDLTRFAGDGVICLRDEEELDSYTYKVAGCVGAFWTKLGFLIDPRFATKNKDEMCELGIRYGKGLQLLNILRDVEKDRVLGRCYLPLLENAENVRDGYLGRIDGFLQSGLEYSKSLVGWRLRTATVLPALIGCETVAKLRAATLEEWKRGVKISRADVRRNLWDAMCFR